ncbi:MAG: endonuclease domain-containing protein [Verrucomicrobiota bacterium]
MRRRIIPYAPFLVERARELRAHMTLAEVLLWKEIKGRKLCGYDFDRQRPIGGFIVDFYCKDLQLAIEVDGWSHNLKEEQDLDRQQALESLGVRVLRFWDCEVKEDRQAVLQRIRDWIEERQRTHPGLRPSGFALRASPRQAPPEEGMRKRVSPPTEGTGGVG